MIKLIVEEYCQKCEEFEPEVCRMYTDEKLVLQEVCCEHKERCANIYKSISDAIRKEKKDD